MMFITDGMSNKGGSPKDQAKDLREKDGFEIYAIGKVLILVIIEYLSASTNRSSAICLIQEAGNFLPFSALCDGEKQVN